MHYLEHVANCRACGGKPLPYAVFVAMTVALEREAHYDAVTAAAEHLILEGTTSWRDDSEWVMANEWKADPYAYH